jgi:hypothetical protein
MTPQQGKFSIQNNKALIPFKTLLNAIREKAVINTIKYTYIY